MRITPTAYKRVEISPDRDSRDAEFPAELGHARLCALLLDEGAHSVSAVGTAWLLDPRSLWIHRGEGHRWLVKSKVACLRLRNGSALVGMSGMIGQAPARALLNGRELVHFDDADRRCRSDRAPHLRTLGERPADLRMRQVPLTESGSPSPRPARPGASCHRLSWIRSRPRRRATGHRKSPPAAMSRCSRTRSPAFKAEEAS